MSQVNFTFPINELAAALAERLQPLFLITQPQEQPPTEKFLTRKETALSLNVSLPTLNEYTKRNLIIGYRFGVRVLYKQSEIDAALTKMNFGK